MSEEHMHEGPKSFITKYIFSLDHKVIGRQFLFYGLSFLLLGGIMAYLIRWQLAFPWTPAPVFGKLFFPSSGGAATPEIYTTLITLHGTIMIFFAITPLVIGAFGNFLIPLQVGARDMAFPVLNMLSFWLMPIAGAFLLVAFFTEQSAAAGWTGYPPLSSATYNPGAGESCWALAVVLLGTSSIMGGINYVTTVLNLRAKGMGMFKLPLTIWGLFLTAILNLAFVPVIAVGLIMLLLDRTFTTHFFTGVAINTAQAGQPLLYQHIFWAFGHPEVYILILPVWGMVSDLLSTFSRKPAFGYKLTALSMCLITLLSAVVWGHHMFISGMSPAMGKTFQSLTMLISIPSSVFFFNWLATLWRGNLRFTTPMLYCIGVIFVFAIGGLTGILLASRTMDIYLHGTYFVVAHFHYTMAMSVFLGSFAAVYFWFPKIFGRMMNETLGKIHFWITFIAVNVVFLVMFRVGLAGLMRRVADPSAYEVFKPLQPLNQIITYGVMVLGTAQLIFIFNFFYSIFKGKKASDNPWEATTLEWIVPSPPPHENFEGPLPVVQCGPHEYGNPLSQGKDFIMQTEKAI